MKNLPKKSNLLYKSQTALFRNFTQYTRSNPFRHARTFGVKFKTFRAKSGFINSQCLRVNAF